MDSPDCFVTCKVWRKAEMPPNEVHARIRAVLHAGENVLAASTVLPWVISSMPHKTVDTSEGRFGMAQTSANRMEQIMIYKPT